MPLKSSFIRKIEVDVKEQLWKSPKGSHKISFGVLKEDTLQEKRVALNPYAVQLLVEQGFDVLVESEAGEPSGYSDYEYSEAGATVVKNPEELFQCDWIIKIAPPNREQIRLLRKNQVLISSLNPSTLDAKYFQQLIEKRITAIAYEYIQDKLGQYPFIQKMSEISGTVVVNMAIQHIASNQGRLIGSIAGVKPIEFLIFGSGSAARQAAKLAYNNGALVKVFDHSISKLRQLSNYVGGTIYTSVPNSEILNQEIQTADVLIGALSANMLHKKMCFSKDLIKLMKKGSLVIDVNKDHSYCFESSHRTDYKQPLVEQDGLYYVGLPNYPSVVPKTSSMAMSHIFLDYFNHFNDFYSIDEFLKENNYFRKGTYLYKGILTNKHIADNFGFSFQDINLILSAF